MKNLHLIFKIGLISYCLIWIIITLSQSKDLKGDLQKPDKVIQPAPKFQPSTTLSVEG